MKLFDWLCLIAIVLAFGMLLAIGMFYRPEAKPLTLVDVLTPSEALWDLPSCPRELTLQDGTRWALPAWSAPGCDASIIYTVEPLIAIPTGQP